MIPENQQEALKKLASKEALLSLIEITQYEGIGGLSVAIDSDGYTYLSISGSAILNEGDGSEYIQIYNIPAGLHSAVEYLATNDNGGGGSVNVSVTGTTATVTFNAGAVGRTVYFSVLLTKHIQGF